MRARTTKTEPGQLDQSLSCRFWKVATHPAYNLGNLWRRPGLPKCIERWSLTSLPLFLGPQSVQRGSRTPKLPR